MKLHLDHTPAPSPVKISHADKILMMGSCFAENIGEYLTNYKFNCEINPNGILFNPISISEAIHSYITNSGQNTIVKNDDLFYSLDHHGDFAFKSENELDTQIKLTNEKIHSCLKNSNWLIITFGSAFVYRYLKTNKIAANCHKLPPSEFKKELLKVEDIVETYKNLISELKKFNPKLNILLTISPVKYLRDGLVENTLSKSILIQSVHEIVNTNVNCHYFPAYELVTDDLRDHRFYKEDLAHPNDQAIKYVWEKFEKTFFSNETIALNEKVKDILQAAQHRPIKDDSEKHLQFKKTYLQKCKALEKEFDFLNFESEKILFS